MIKYILLIFPFFVFSQTNKITFLDELSKKPIIGLQIFSETGSFIATTNSDGQFELNIELLQQANIKSIIAYNTNYFSLEYKLNEIPTIIYLKNNEPIQLETVTITSRGPKDYFTLKAYFRSWKLVNGKLVKYGDGIVNYNVPYGNIVNDFNTGIKNNFLSYRTFKVDSIKNKSRIISFSSFDDYLNTYITKNDMLKRGSKHYKVKLVKDNYGTIYDDGKEVGYVIYDENNNPSEINASQSFEGDEAIKMLFWKISGKFKEIEKWTDVGNTRHPTYLFNSSKTAVKTKIEGKFNYVETITEIFIDDAIVHDYKKPEKYKSNIDKDRSFYNSNYWDEKLLKHPLPSEIKSQLTKVNENKNTY